MKNKLIVVIAALGILWGCAEYLPPGQVTSTPTPYEKVDLAKGQGNALVFDPNQDVESALPEMRDLPAPSTLKRPKRSRQYTGIIKNRTKYEVSVPSGNSGATLIIPPRGFIEYSAWSKAFHLTAYHDGRPFYCMNIHAHPKAYAYMCRKYDFMVEIVKPEPVHKKKKRFRRKKRTPKKAGVEAYG